MKRVISNFVAAFWFFYMVIWMALALPFVTIELSKDIKTIVKCGFSMTSEGVILLMIFGFVFGITMLVPVFRKCFHVLPWLYPYITILTADFTILAIGIEILNYGYQVQSDARHTFFFWLMIAQMVVCRIVLCIFCNKKTMRIEREDDEQ